MRERKNPRPPFFDYRSIAAYFVTICSKDRQSLFGEVVQGRTRLNTLGCLVAEEWERSQKLRNRIVLDAWIVMPNHVHGIVCIVPPGVDTVSPRGYRLDLNSNSIYSEEASTDDVGPHGDAALREKESHPRWKEGRPQRHAKSLGSMIAGFKGAVTKNIHKHRSTVGIPVWQSRYHDRIIRNEREWRARRRYIERNPERWMEDPYCSSRRRS